MAFAPKELDEVYHNNSKKSPSRKDLKDPTRTVSTGDSKGDISQLGKRKADSKSGKEEVRQI